MIAFRYSLYVTLMGAQDTGEVLGPAVLTEATLERVNASRYTFILLLFFTMLTQY